MTNSGLPPCGRPARRRRRPRARPLRAPKRGPRRRRAQAVRARPRCRACAARPGRRRAATRAARPQAGRSRADRPDSAGTWPRSARASPPWPDRSSGRRRGRRAPAPSSRRREPAARWRRTGRSGRRPGHRRPATRGRSPPSSAPSSCRHGHSPERTDACAVRPRHLPPVPLRVDEHGVAQRRLAHPRLARDEHDPADALGGAAAQLGDPAQRPVAPVQPRYAFDHGRRVWPPARLRGSRLRRRSTFWLRQNTLAGSALGRAVAAPVVPGDAGPVAARGRAPAPPWVIADEVAHAAGRLAGPQR